MSLPMTLSGFWGHLATCAGHIPQKIQHFTYK